MLFFKKKWAKEVNQATFDNIDVHQFRKVSFSYFTAYLTMWVGVVIALAVLASDIYTAIMLLAFDRWSSTIDPYVPIRISRWIFGGCIILSVLLLIYNYVKAYAAIKTNNITYNYTTPIARNYFSIKSYDHFCLFLKITKSKSKMEYLALFVYFSFKNWIGLVFAEGPRQAINALTLYSVLKIDGDFSGTVKKIGQSSLAEAIVLGLMAFSLLVWVINFVSFLFALISALPLLVHIEKECSCLEEYCCVRINRRVAKLVANKQKKGLLELAEEKSKQGFALASSSVDSLEKGNVVITATSSNISVPPMAVKHSASQATLRESPSSFRKPYTNDNSNSSHGVSRKDSNGSAETYVSNQSNRNMANMVDRNPYSMDVSNDKDQLRLYQTQTLNRLQYGPLQPVQTDYIPQEPSAVLYPPPKAPGRNLTSNGILTSMNYDMDSMYTNSKAPYPINDDEQQLVQKEEQQRLSPARIARKPPIIKTLVSGAKGGPTYSVYNPFQNMSSASIVDSDHIPLEPLHTTIMHPELELTDIQPTIPFTSLDNSSRISRLDASEVQTKEPTLPVFVIDEDETSSEHSHRSDNDDDDPNDTNVDLIDKFYGDETSSNPFDDSQLITDDSKGSKEQSSSSSGEAINRKPTMLNKRINQREKLSNCRRSVLDSADDKRQPALPSFAFDEDVTGENAATQKLVKKSKPAGQSYTSYDFF